MAYNRRKRKVKKNIPEAQAHIHSTYNNTVVSITDVNGNVISWASAGTQGIKGSKDRSRIPQQLCEHIVDICEEGFDNLIDLQYMVDELIRIAKNSTSEGNWIYQKEEIDFHISEKGRLL